MDVVVLKEVIFNIFYFVWMWWSWKNLFLSFSTLCGCGGLERTDFNHSLFCVDVVVLKVVIFNIFYFVWMWWSWEELILNSFFYFVWMWWSWEKWFLIFSNLCGYDGQYWKNWLLKSFYFVSMWCSWRELIFYILLLCVDVMVLKELTFNSFYFVWMQWS